MPKPIVVIIGRPNVGKSTLFNRMSGSQAAIVVNTPGVTRDRHYLDAEWEGKPFVVVDTGGFYPESSDDIFLQVKEQALFAIEEGDVIIHLLDGKDGLTPSDMEIARLLRTSGKKVFWAVNKIDAPSREERLYDFYPLGADELWPVSAATGFGYEDFMDKLVEFLPPYDEEKTEYPKVAVVGRPNVGKSTLINTLLSKKRMIVSPLPGTTRDSIDSVCTYYGKKYLFIDTAGIRRKDAFSYSIERFAMVRTVRSVERCDVAIIVLDVSEGIVEQDQNIAGIITSLGKGSLVVLNKWDLMENPEEAYARWQKEFRRKIWFMPYAPFLTISAIEKKRVTKIFPVIDEIIKERRKRIRTADLNNTLKEVLSTMTSYRGKSAKIYYMTQVRTEPPTFAVFTNYPASFRDSHTRHIEKVLRNKFSFTGTPLKIYIRDKEKEKRQ
jgi:GTPase